MALRNLIRIDLWLKWICGTWFKPTHDSKQICGSGFESTWLKTDLRKLIRINFVNQNRLAELDSNQLATQCTVTEKPTLKLPNLKTPWHLLFSRVCTFIWPMGNISFVWAAPQLQKCSYVPDMKGKRTSSCFYWTSLWIWNRSSASFGIHTPGPYFNNYMRLWVSLVHS